MTTLTGHLAAERQQHGSPDPALSALLERLAGAGRALAREIRRAALTGREGPAGGRNVTGDIQTKLDVVGNEVLLRALDGPGLVAVVVSEELPEARTIEQAGRFVVCVDPLDGSSNTDVNGSLGTIFGVYRRVDSGPVDPTRDVLRAGADQVLAGYVLYGPSTVLVYTAGRGTHAFTLDPERDEFVLSRPRVRCPARGVNVAANLVRARAWHPGLWRFADAIMDAAGGKHRAWSVRYTGALVADVHRALVDGGLYMYPADTRNPEGKLRLLYECAPLAYVVEQAGGAASTGTRRVLDVQATTIHQRAPLVIGSAEDVALVEAFVSGAARDAG